MSTNVEKLLIIQDRDRKISRLSREIQDMPERKRMIEAQLDAHTKAVAEAEDAIRKKKSEQKDLEAQITQRQERIQKVRQQQMDVKNNDDYRAFESQVVVLNQEIREIEDRELVMMESIEKLSAVLAEKKTALKEEEKIVGEDIERFKQRAANIEKDLEETKANRDALTQDVDSDWLSRYDRLFQNKGDYALVTVEHSTCGGCHMKLPPQAAHDARKLDSMTVCMYCGRLLYYIP